MAFPRRPGHGETDEDLLKQQEVFLAKREEPSVKVLKTMKTEPQIGSKDEETNPRSEMPQSAASSSQEPAVSVQSQSGYSEKPSVSPLWVSPPQASTPLLPASAVSKKDEGEDFSKPKRKSLFALRMEKSRVDTKKKDQGVWDQVHVSKPDSRFGEHSYIISGKEAKEIHQQNVAQLERLSMQEIEEERQRLMSQLSSSTIKFLQSRREANRCDDKNIELNKAKSEIKEVKEKPVRHVGVSSTPSLAKERNKVFSNTLTSPRDPVEAKQPDTSLFDTLPINPNEAKRWLHMDVVEKDKLEWMKELSPIKTTPKPDEPYSARFDFQGLLLPFNDDKIEVNKGLHHHGDEPERPGYTLQELMQLSRSSVQQQRVMGLNSLGNILLKAKLGIFDIVLHQNVVKELLDAGIFLLLRFSLDDTSPPVIIAALTAMRNLVCNEPDEASLDFFLGCEGGLQHPLLEVPSGENDARKIQEQKDQEAELKDFELIQLDVLKGALRTNLIVRLGYILDVIKGPPDIVLDILIRIARHSRQLSEAIVICGGLLRTISEQLLTTHVVSSLAAGFGHSSYGEPSAKALKLMRVLAGQSRTIANTLVDKFNIMEPVMTYVSMSSPELPHIQSLVVHGFYLWQTLMSYGLASQSIIDLFPILMRQLHFHSQLTSAVGEDSSPSGHELATALVGVIEKAADIVSYDHNVLEPKPVFQLAKLTVDCLRKWLTQLSSQSTEIPSWSCLKMIGAAFNCLAVTASCAKKQNLPDSRSFIEKLESFVHEIALPFLKSLCLQKLLENLKPSSYFLSSGESGSKRDPPNLPSLGAMEWGGENLVPGLLPKAPHPFLSGLLNFFTKYHEIFGSSSNKFQSFILDSSALDKYVQALVREPLRCSDHWFCRLEVYMLHHLVAFIVLQPTSVLTQDRLKYSQLAFRVVDWIQANDKYLISNLLPVTFFSPEFCRWAMNDLTLEKETHDLVEDSLLCLPHIGPHYLDILGIRFARVPSPSKRTSLTSLQKGSEPALPVDWQFAPLLLLYGQYNAQNRARCSERDTALIVANSLQFLFLMETLCPKSRRPLSVTARWCRLSLVFLAGADLFFDDDVKRYLKANIDHLLLHHNKLNFKESIPGLSSFYDLYGELLLQFSAVSYGDRLFGAFLLHPLQQKQDPQLRRMVWGENAVVLHMLSTPLAEVGVPIEEYLEPCETDPSLLSPYLEFVGKGLVVEARCPVLYRVAVHHVATFIQQYKDHPYAISLQKRISYLGNENLQQIFLNYHYSPSTHISSYT